MSEHAIEVILNGRPVRARVESRRTLGDFLRRDAGQTGTHLACEHGVCGACTVIVDGEAVRSCLMLAVQADGRKVTTVEGLEASDGSLHRVQQAMQDAYALQCGYCTPGVVMTLAAALEANPKPTEPDLMEALSGHLCRCTGYQGMMKVAKRLAGGGE